MIAHPPGVSAKPRPPLPPAPEFAPRLWHERFDQYYGGRVTNAQLSIPNYGVLSESWSGFSLQRSGNVPPLIVPALSKGRTNIACESGAIRFWIKLGETVPETDGRLITLATLTDNGPLESWSLRISRDGSTIYLVVQRSAGPEIALQASGFQPGIWHLLCLTYSPNATSLLIDGKLAAEGAGISSVDPKTAALVIGSNFVGTETPEAEFEEIFTFAVPLSERIVAAYYTSVGPIAALGPLTLEEEQATRAAYAQAAAQKSFQSVPQPYSLLSASTNPCTPDLLITKTTDDTNGNIITVTITNGATGTNYELFRTYELPLPGALESPWRRIARGTNGQSFTFTNKYRFPVAGGSRRQQAFFAAICDSDDDGDELSNGFELLISRTDPGTNATFGTPDKDYYLLSNVLVNDPDYDFANPQNTQFETTIGVCGNNVIVGFVDSNRGLFGLSSGYVPGTNRMVGYAVSTDGGVTFTDMDVPPLDAEGLGDVGDPVLAVDETTTNLVYLTGTSPKDSHHGVPFWKSTNGGITFVSQPLVHGDITDSDHPWITVDNSPGTGQRDVYITVTGQTTNVVNQPIFLIVSTNQGSNWSSEPLLVSDDVIARGPVVAIGPDHAAYVVWYQGFGSNFIKMRRVTDRGTTRWPETNAQSVYQIVSTNTPNGDLQLKRRNSTNETERLDTFWAFPFPVAAANPSRTGHVYIAFADKGTNNDDKADVFVVRSTDGGTNWTARQRINSDSTTNDQWMPVMCLKPDGNQMFFAWYDRRLDLASNSLIDVYGRFATIETDGSLTFGSEFRINTVSFTPVFAGTDTNNLIDGHYDPVYPPNGVDLHWWYPPWPIFQTVSAEYYHHVGEYNGAWATTSHVWFVWTDARLSCVGAAYGYYPEDPQNPTGPEVGREVPLVGYQRDIRFVRLSWP